MISQQENISLSTTTNMLSHDHVDTEIEDPIQDKAQPLVSELLHEVAPNFAFPLALGAKSCDLVLSLSMSTALHSNILLHQCH
jgi:hypothetical protein